MRLFPCLRLRRPAYAFPPLEERRSPTADLVTLDPPAVQRGSAGRIGIALAAAVTLGAAAPPPGAPIVVTVAGVSSDRGSIRVDVCTRKTFLRTTCPYSGVAPARAGETTVKVGDVPPGVYAVQVYHDLDDDQEVDQGLLGVPQEGLGFSREPRLGLRGPSFESAAITHDDEEQTLHVRLRFEPSPQGAGSASIPPPQSSRSARREPAVE